MIVSIILSLVMNITATPLERPLVTIAQGQIESGLNPKAVGASGEKGAYQVLEKYWGKVPRTLEAQARQAESILNSLISENNGSHFEALIKYNSYKNRKKGIVYACKVRKRALELAVVGV